MCGCPQDPKQRITMAKVMKHPWVTKRGQWPLKSVREMMHEHGKVDEDEPELPDLMSTFNVLDVPRQVGLRLEALQRGRSDEMARLTSCWMSLQRLTRYTKLQNHHCHTSYPAKDAIEPQGSDCSARLPEKENVEYKRAGGDGFTPTVDTLKFLEQFFHVLPSGERGERESGRTWT